MGVNNFTTTEKFETKIKKLAADHRLELSTNEVQTITITGTPTGGTFTLTYNGETTAVIAYNASAATIIAALKLLDGIGTDDITSSGGSLPGTAVVVTFAGDLSNIDVPLMLIDTALLTGGTNPAGTVEETIKGLGDNIIAARRLTNAYNVILGVLMARGLTKVQVDTWARGEEYQLDIATYWYCKDSGWGGKIVDEVDWTKVFDREKELKEITLISTTNELLLKGKVVALAMDLLEINANLGIYP